MPAASRFRRTRRPRGQRGYVLLMVVLAIAVMVIGMTAIAPTLRTQIQRDRETEMIHRGEQYARAVRRYYRKFGRYPARIEELEKTINIRFLRKRYKDPMSEEGSWRLVHLGDVRLTSLPANSPLMGSTPSTSSPGSQSAFGGGTTGRGPNSPGGSMFGSGSSGTDQNSNDAGSSSFGKQVFGGGPMLGVASTVNKVGIHSFNGKDNYKDWLFIYDPLQDRGGLIKGPYNPNLYKQQGGGIGSPIAPGGGLPNIPGVNGPSGMFGTTPQPQPQP